MNKFLTSLLYLGAIGLLSLMLFIKRGHTYGAIIILIASLIYLAYYRHCSLPSRADYWLFYAFIGYGSISITIALCHQESLRDFDHPLKILLFAPMMFFLLRFPLTPLFFFVCAAIGACGAGGIALWDKLILGLERASGYINPIFFGELSGLLVILCLCGIPLYHQQMHQTPRNYYTALLILGSFLGMIAVVLSGTRGSWVAIPVVLIGVMRLYRTSQRSNVFLLGATLFILLGSYVLPQTGVKQRFNQVTHELSNKPLKTQAASVTGRLEIWKHGIDMIIKKPLIGWGESKASVEKQRLIDTNQIPNKASGIGHWHNIFIEKSVKQGILGLIALITIYTIPLVLFFSSLKNNDSLTTRVLAYSGILTIIAYIIYGLTDILFTYNAGTLFFGFIVLFLWSMIRHEQQDTKHHPL